MHWSWASWLAFLIVDHANLPKRSGRSFETFPENPSAWAWVLVYQNDRSVGQGDDAHAKEIGQMAGRRAGQVVHGGEGREPVEASEIGCMASQRWGMKKGDSGIQADVRASDSTTCS